MSVTIDTSMGLRDLQAETLPLPESHPDSPCNRDEAATNALTTCIQARLIQSVTVQAPEADDDACAGAVEDVKYDADSALNSHKSIGSSSSSKSAAFAVAHDENVEKIVVDDNKFDTEESESVKDLETATSVDDNKTNQVNTTSPDTEPKIEVHATEKDATASDSSDQVVASPEVKRKTCQSTILHLSCANSFKIQLWILMTPRTTVTLRERSSPASSEEA